VATPQARSSWRASSPAGPSTTGDLFVRPRRLHPDHCQADACRDPQDHDPPRLLPSNPDVLLAETVEVERYIRWADLMRKVHRLEVLDCPCGGKRKVVGLVRDLDQIRATLERIRLPCMPLRFAMPQEEALQARTAVPVPAQVNDSESFKGSLYPVGGGRHLKLDVLHED
jgi:hypothetical protein